MTVVIHNYMHLSKLTELYITKNEFLKTKKQKQNVEEHKMEHKLIKTKLYYQ